jgi:hypothetical protein
MTVLHGTMTGAEVDALRLILPAHIVTFRGALAHLATAGQAALPLDVFRLFFTTLTPFPFSSSMHYCLLWRTGQLRNRRSRRMPCTSFRNCTTHSNPRPFAGNLEGYGGGASEDDGMEGDLIYPPKTYPQYPTANTMQPYYPPPRPQPQHFLPPPWPWVPTLPLPQV